MTEQTEITVTFKIHELLRLYDQLIIAHDHGQEFDEENKAICVYLCDRLLSQIPEFTESKDFYKPIKL